MKPSGLFTHFFIFRLNVLPDASSRLYTLSKTQDPSLSPLLKQLSLKATWPPKKAKEKSSGFTHLKPSPLVLKECLQVAPFCFPDIQQAFLKATLDDPPNYPNIAENEQFSFSLTLQNGKRVNGFVLRVSGMTTKSVIEPNICTAYVFLSDYHFSSMFLQALSVIRLFHVAEDSDKAISFVRNMYTAKWLSQDDSLEDYQMVISLPKTERKFTFSLPNTFLKSPKRSVLSGDSSFAPLCAALDPPQLSAVFASLIFERNVILISSSLGQLGAISSSLANLSLYPLEWTHVFIPLLPPHLIAYVTAPFPYIIGVHSSYKYLLDEFPIGTSVIVDLDEKSVAFFNQDLDNISQHRLRILLRDLERSAGKWKKSFSSSLGTDPVVRPIPSFPENQTREAFLRFWAGLFDKYHLSIRPISLIVNSVPDLKKTSYLLAESDKHIDGATNFKYGFDLAHFIQTRASSEDSEFLKSFVLSQMFEQFIHHRLYICHRHLQQGGTLFTDLMSQSTDLPSSAQSPITSPLWSQPASFIQSLDSNPITDGNDISSLPSEEREFHIFEICQGYLNQRLKGRNINISAKAHPATYKFFDQYAFESILGSDQFQEEGSFFAETAVTDMLSSVKRFFSGGSSSKKGGQSTISSPVRGGSQTNSGRSSPISPESQHDSSSSPSSLESSPSSSPATSTKKISGQSSTISKKKVVPGKKKATLPRKRTKPPSNSIQSNSTTLKKKSTRSNKEVTKKPQGEITSYSFQMGSETVTNNSRTSLSGSLSGSNHRITLTPEQLAASVWNVEVSGARQSRMRSESQSGRDRPTSVLMPGAMFASFDTLAIGDPKVRRSVRRSVKKKPSVKSKKPTSKRKRTVAAATAKT